MIDKEQNQIIGREWYDFINFTSKTGKDIGTQDKRSGNDHEDQTRQIFVGTTIKHEEENKQKQNCAEEEINPRNQ